MRNAIVGVGRCNSFGFNLTSGGAFSIATPTLTISSISVSLRLSPKAIACSADSPKWFKTIVQPVALLMVAGVIQYRCLLNGIYLFFLNTVLLKGCVGYQLTCFRP
jgi:hypothetical protein